MRKFNKFFATILSVVMFISFIPIVSTANTSISGNCGDNVTWDMNLSTGTLTFSGLGRMYQKYGGDVDIPWEDYWRYIKTVVIEEDVEFVDVGLFNFSCGNKFVVDSDNQYYSTDEYGALFNKDKTKLFRHCCGNIGKTYTIPNTVTTICEEAFSGCSVVENVVIPDSVTTIEDYAFCGCTILEDVVVPDSVTTIGNSAFSSCENLKKIALGNGVKTIGSSAFAHCKNLASITIGNNVTKIGKNILYGTEYAENLDNWNSGLYVGNCLIAINPDLYSRQIKDKAYRIKSGTRMIADGALSSYYNEPIVIPDSVEIISSCAFEYDIPSIKVDDNNKYFCSDENGVLFDKDKTTLVRYPKGNTRTSYTIPDSVTKIGESAFENCDNLKSIIIPDSVEIIDNNAFYSCDGIADIVFPSGVTIIGDGAVQYCKKLENITLGNNVKTIGSKAFANCQNLGRVVIGNQVTTIGNYAFQGCNKLEDISLTNSVITIGEGAFSGCDSLTSVTIPNNVSSIGVAVFSGCLKLTEIDVDINNPYFSNDNYGVLFNKNKTRLIQYPIGATSVDYIIPDSVTTIGDYAFCCCENLGNVIIPDSVTTIGSSAFAECCGLTNIVISDSVKEIGPYVYRDCINLEKAIIGNGITSIPRWTFMGCTSLESVTIGENVTAIETRAFGECISLENITLPDNVTTLDYGAFLGAGLKNVTFGKGLIRIGYSAFSGCENLTSVIIPGNVREIGSCAFRDCGNLETVIIEKGTMTIGSYAFGDCVKLKDIKMPNSVRLICEIAFGYCTSLTDVYYSGSEEQWNKTTIEEDNECLLNANFHFNYCEHQDYDDNGCCDDCNTLLDLPVECDHGCHKDGISGFFWRIINIFNMLFGLNKTCDCGVAHY